MQSAHIKRHLSEKDTFEIDTRSWSLPMSHTTVNCTLQLSTDELSLQNGFLSKTDKNCNSQHTLKGEFGFNKC